MKTADLSFLSTEDIISGYLRPSSSSGGNSGPVPAFLFMGKTGAGKSSMIKLLGGKDLNGAEPIVDEGTESCTTKSCIYKTDINNKRVLLLDTPGFDDSVRNNFEILREIVSHLYLFALQKGEVAIRGVIFLHDIGEVRLGGSQKKTWQILRSICGDDAMKNVIVGTTMWSSPNSRKFMEEEKRETELCGKHWGGIYKSARVIYEDRDNAVQIINDLLARPPVLLLVQQEMLKPPHTVDSTTAGNTAMPEGSAERDQLKKEYEAQQKKHEEEARQREEAFRKQREEEKRKHEEEQARQREAARKREQEQQEQQRRREEQIRRDEEERRRQIEEAERIRRRIEEEQRRRNEEMQREREEAARRYEEELQRQREETRRREEENQRRIEEERRREEARRREWEAEMRRREEHARSENERIQREIEAARRRNQQDDCIIL